jgi:hypothetical protein
VNSSIRFVSGATLAAALLVADITIASAEQSASDATAPTMEEAQRLFYSGRFDSAAALALAARTAAPENLPAFELRSSALHFQIRRALGTSADRDRAWKLCASCPDLLSTFVAETNLGRSVAHARLKRNAADEEALYFLGKLNLNFVWLHLGTLGRRSGWNEYWEARKSLDAVLRTNPEHIRARLARAWIDYIVDTKVPWGARWMLGGGDKRRGLQVVHEAALTPGPPYVQAEAMFALWDMQVRERNLEDAIVTARALSHDFPDNPDLAKFLSTYDLRSSR